MGTTPSAPSARTEQSQSPQTVQTALGASAPANQKHVQTQGQTQGQTPTDSKSKTLSSTKVLKSVYSSRNKSMSMRRGDSHGRSTKSLLKSGKSVKKRNAAPVSRKDLKLC